MSDAQLRAETIVADWPELTPDQIDALTAIFRPPRSQ